MTVTILEATTTKELEDKINHHILRYDYGRNLEIQYSTAFDTKYVFIVSAMIIDKGK